MITRRFNIKTIKKELFSWSYIYLNIYKTSHDRGVESGGKFVGV